MWRRDWSPVGFLGLAFVAAVGAILFTLILPALIAHSGDVFYDGGIRKRLKGDAKTRFLAFEEIQARRAKAIDELDGQILDAIQNNAPAAAILRLMSARNHVESVRRTAKAPIAVIPFYLNPQMLLWPAVYTCLMWIVIILRPEEDLSFLQVLLSRKTLQLGFVAYVFYAWPLWLRNFVLGDHGRVVFAYPNVDIHKASFIAQEVVVLGFCLLLAVIWRQWAVYLLRVRQDDPAQNDVPQCVAMLTDPEAARSFADVFFRWMFCSAVLALGFIGLTAFYWNLVGKYGDQRYLLSAILGHVLWGITWIVLSLPLLNEWRLWDQCRTHAYQQLLNENGTEAATRKMAVIKEVQPVTAGTFLFANVVSAVSFVFPIIQAFVR